MQIERPSPESAIAQDAAVRPALDSDPQPVGASTGDQERTLPMLDVHPPHEAAHTWKGFFIHIATIVVGLLIAIGLEQTVEYFHHRHQIAEVRETLRIERRINANRFAVVTDEFRRFVPKLEANLATFQYLRLHPNTAPAQWPGKLDWLAMSTAFVDSAWKTAQQSSVLQYMPQAEVKQNDELYTQLQQLSERIKAEQTALNNARRFAIQDPDPSHLSPAQLERQIDLTSEVLLQYALAGRAQNNLAIHYTDFSPSLTRDDVYRILHATTDAEDQKAISALSERMRRFEQEQGVDSPDLPSVQAVPDPSQK
jgi:hypothetical protein